MEYQEIQIIELQIIKVGLHLNTAPLNIGLTAVTNTEIEAFDITN